ncbi:MAG: hypothetical protein K2N93_03670 [Alistipes sp.]|nr:hypothetical protein [Alistipes sp.]
MKSPLLYLVEVLFCSGALAAFYRLLLARKVSFVACRRFLLAAVVVPLVLPALDIPIYPARTVVYPLPLVVPVAEEPLDPAGDAFAAAAAQDGPVAPAEPAVDRLRIARRVAAGSYGAVVVLLAGILLVRVASIRRMRRRSRLTDCGDYVLAEHPAVTAPFSFLRTVFLGEGFEGERRAIVLCHEASHVRHRHSAERIAVECVRCLFWFNPFVWMAQRWLAEVQEWEADRDVLDAGYDLTCYRTVIFHQLFGYNPDIVCGLNHSFIKNRFVMMTQFRKRTDAALRLGAALPVVAGMMMLCSFTPREASADERPAKVSVAHVGSDGVTLDGRLLSPEQLVDYIAAERARLSESERATMGLRLTREGDGKVRAEITSVPVVELCGDGSLRLNGETTTLSGLEERLRARREALTAEQFQRTEVCIAARGEGVAKGLVDRVRQVLRRTGWLRVRYMADGAPAVSRMLPPLPAASADGKVTVLKVDVTDNGPVDGPVVVVKERNLFTVRVDRTGRILAGGIHDPREIALGDLAARVGAFLRNADGSDALPVREDEEFGLPDGRRATWAVSRGVVSLEACDCAYATYCAVQQALTEAFDGLRDEASRVWFGRSFAALAEAERASVLRAVPVRVFETEPGGDVPSRR